MNAYKGGLAPFLFELSGEHPSLPHAEVMACVLAECSTHSFLSAGPGYTLVGLRPEQVGAVAARLALTHRLGRFLGEVLPDGEVALDQGVVVEGSVAVRVKRFQMLGQQLDTNLLVHKLGKILTKDRKVDLENPDVEYRGLITDRTLIYVKTHEIDRAQFDQRAVKERPFFSPISLHPRLARALVNLSGVRRGERLLDPFCGTGGVLIEAALIGARPFGSDLSDKMIDGCAKNMEHFGLRAESLEQIDIGDVPDTFGEVEAVATDPPYGRSASTNREALSGLYERSMDIFSRTIRPDRRLSVAFPRQVDAPCSLELLETHVQRVHRSLNRRFCVYRRIQ